MTGWITRSNRGLFVLRFNQSDTKKLLLGGKKHVLFYWVIAIGRMAFGQAERDSKRANERASRIKKE
jgi:hypothetical protein